MLYNPMMHDFLQFAQDLIVLRGSPKHCAIVQRIVAQLNDPQTHIRPLCLRRFTENFRALHGFITQTDDIICEALEVVE